MTGLFLSGSRAMFWLCELDLVVLKMTVFSSLGLAGLRGFGLRAGVCAGVLLGLATLQTGHAFAFEQITGPGAGSNTAAHIPGIEIAPQSTSRGAGLELTLPGALGGSDPGAPNVGLTFPGLGSLPKLDFGLELLYGTPDQGTPNNDEIDSLPNALTVHGAVKKTF